MTARRQSSQPQRQPESKQQRDQRHIHPSRRSGMLQRHRQPRRAKTSTGYQQPTSLNPSLIGKKLPLQPGPASNSPATGPAAEKPIMPSAGPYANVGTTKTTPHAT
ncbi:hypothetical protein BC567DRAFT_236683 [Phyllosticta citribraziliensis]